MKTLKFFFVMIFIVNINFETFADKNDQLVIKISKNLRCLICQGQSIYDSQSDFAISMKFLIKEKINNGLNEKEIYEFLKEKYGEWIVYKPKFNYLNSFLWISPYIVLILGGYLIFKYFRKRKQ